MLALSPVILPACVINAATLKEGGSAIGFQEITFGYVDGFKNSRVEGDIKLPARHVEDIFCEDVKGKGIARMN